MRHYYAYRKDLVWSRIPGKHGDGKKALEALDEDPEGVLITENPDNDWLSGLMGAKSWMRYDHIREVRAIGANKKAADEGWKKCLKEAEEELVLRRRGKMSSNQVIRDLCNKTIQEAAPRRQKFLQSANAQAGEPSISSLYHTMVVYGLEVVEDEGKAQLARKILEHHEQEPGEDLEPFCRKLIEREKQASPPNHMCANPLEFPLKYAMWQGERKFVDQLFLKLEIHVASIKSAKHTIGQRSEEMAEYLMTKGGGTK